MKSTTAIALNNLAVFAMGIGAGILMANSSETSNAAAFVYIIIGVIALAFASNSIIKLNQKMKGGLKKENEHKHSKNA